MDYVKYITADGVTKQVKDPEAAAASNLAPDYSTLTFPVAVGTKCTNNGVLYRCKTAISASEAFTPAHWEVISVYADLQAHFPDTGKLVAGTGTASANYAAAVGQGTRATQQGAHAEGIGGTASGTASHAEGSSSTASGAASHAEGDGTTASGAASHAEGSSSEARGDYSHTEGYSTIADGEAAHAEGDSTGAKGDASHASGEGTVANRKAQTVFGRYNVGEQTSSTLAKQYGEYAEIVGNGNMDTRSNARTLDWSGNEALAGDLTINKGKADETNVGTELKKKVNRSSVTAVKTAYSEDGTVTVDDALDEPAKVVIGLEPKQDLHGYEKPWVGGSGKNKFQSDNYSGNGITINYTNNGLIINGTATANVIHIVTLNNPLTAGNYTLSASNPIANSNVLLRASTSAGSAIELPLNSINKSATFTTNDEIVTVTVRVASGTTLSNFVVYPQLELGSTATSYEPYSNICPIEGYDSVTIISTGKNLLNVDDLEPGYISENGELINDSNYSRTKYIPVKSGEQYAFSLYHNGTSQAKCVHGYDANRNWVAQLGVISTGSTTVPTLKGVSLTIPNNVKFVRIASLVMSLDTDVQLELGSSATDYEPFGQSITVNVKSVNNDSAVYGGTVTVNEDGSGTVVVDRACTNGSVMTWVKSAATTNAFISKEGFSPYLVAHTEAFNGETSYGYDKKTYQQLIADGVDHAISYRAQTAGFMIRDSRLSSHYQNFDLAAFQQAVSDLDVLYPITPQSYPLTASQIQTLLGTNHLWTDSGCEFTLDYHTDKYGKLDEVYSAFPEGSVGPDDVVTITDGADNIPVKSLSVAIEPKQDLHGYTHPWVGGAGKNKLDYKNFAVSTPDSPYTTIIDDGVKIVNESERQYASVRYEIMDITSAATAYKLSCDVKCNIVQRVRLGIRSIQGNSFLNDGSQYINCTPWFDMQAGETKHLEMTINYESGTSWYLSLCCTGATAIAADTEFTNIQLELGSTATDYEPYSNICPISGWDAVNVTRTGKNLIPNNLTWKNGLRLDDGTITENTASKHTCAIHGLKPNTRYTISGKFTDANIAARVYYLKADESWISRSETFADSGSSVTYSFTTPEECDAIQVQCGRSYDLSNVQLELGSTPTAYEPYRSTTLPISLSRAGTVYGGTLDVGTGVMTVEKVCYKVSDFTQIAYDSTNGWFYVNKSKFPNNQDPLAPASASVIGDGLISSFAEAVSRNSLPNMSVAVCVGTNQALLIKTGHTTVVDLVAAYGNETVVYTLATPITYQLSPRELTTLLGTNNIWSDGQVTVEYRADPKLYIAKHEMSAEDRQDITDIKAHFPDTGRLVTGICTASADYAAAVGNSTTASGFGATAQGSHTLASGMNSHAEGSDTQAIAGNSHAEGNGAVASGSGSHAEGKSSQASKIASHAEGNSTAASGSYSHAEGSDTVASGSCSHAEGYSTTASKDYTHAEGCETTASGLFAHAEGLGTVANHAAQHVFGEYNVADDSSAAATSRGNFAEIVGNGANSHNLSNARTLDWSGNEVLAGGLTVNKIAQVSAQTRTEDGYTIKTIRLEGDELELWRMEEIPGTGILDNTVTLRYSDLFNLLQMLNYYRSITPFTAAEMEQLRNLIAGNGGEVPVEIPTETVGDGEEPASGDGLEEEPAVIP